LVKQNQMPGVESLTKVLELERSKGYADRAVIGGLDEYLHRQAGRLREAIDDPELASEFDGLNLGNSGYSSLDTDGRKRWIADLLGWLNKVKRWECGTLASAEASAAGVMAVSEVRQERRDMLDLPVTVIKGIAPGIADKLARLSVRTVYDLLYLLPRRYLDYSRRRPISELVVGDEQTVVGTIWQARVATLGSRRGTEAIVGDETGNVRVVWFNQPYLARSFRTNAKIAISGTVSEFRGQKVFESPAWEMLKEKELIHTGRLVPVYPLTQGLYPKQVRKWIKEAVDGYVRQLGEFLPAEIRSRHLFPDLPTAIAQIHYPDDRASAEAAVRRLSFDELFLLQLVVLARKREWQEGQPGHALCLDQEMMSRFLNSLPFGLTRAQERVLREVLADMQQPRAMSRLLQGEVGSGKTVIATLALLVAAANGYQGALMAPTEVLAEQHYHNLCSYLSNVGTQEPGSAPGDLASVGTGTEVIIRYTGFLSRPLTVALQVGSLSSGVKEALHRAIEAGEVDIAIGTHALIQKEVQFKKLGLAVIDEQHRFGVVQRSALRQKGFNPHVLVMTATPIPRTMALTLYGDLDLSIIDELPPGRQMVKTRQLGPQDREKAYSFIRRQVSNGRQAFVICPLVQESEALEAKAATREYERLSGDVFPDLRVGLLHGQMPSSEKEEVMRRFRSGKLDILVSTSVVEVGIDVPRASVMMVEGAERFGLSQLHQFRGRVGRDKEQGYCLLIMEKASPEAGARLQLMEKVHDGFVLAEKDLELRGPGEFFGTHQSGLPDLKLARLTDLPSLERARQEALALFHSDPDLRKTEHRPLRERLSRAWSGAAEWS
jgi:ATP-dependent DNA helicase RecG